MKLWRTTPCSTRALQRQASWRGDAQRLVAGVLRVQSFTILSSRTASVLRAVDEPRSPRRPVQPPGNARELASARGTFRLPARRAALHVPHLTGPMPNPIARSERRRRSVSRRSLRRVAVQRRGDLAAPVAAGVATRDQARDPGSPAIAASTLRSRSTTQPALLAIAERLERGALEQPRRPCRQRSGRTAAPALASPRESLPLHRLATTSARAP